MDAARRKRLEETTRYEPGQVEERILERVARGRVLPSAGRGNAGGELLDRDPAAERHRGPSHGACAERHDPGRPDADQPDARPQHALGRWAPTTPGSRPRPWSRGSSAKKEPRATSSVARRSSSGSGSGGSEYGSTIVEQFKRLGASCDYERERFTLDEGYVRAVYRVFMRLYEKGYIYRDNYMVNWDPARARRSPTSRSRTARSRTRCTRIDYPVEGSDGVLTVATVRPETMLADTAVAVNPDRRALRGDLVGEHCVLPLVGRRLPVIADEHVDPEFGTGALKITPGHDPNDFEIGRAHGLEEIGVIGEDGRMTAEAGERFAGLTAAEAQGGGGRGAARRGRCSAPRSPTRTRCPSRTAPGERIEPLISLQWFCRMDELAAPAIEVVERDRVRIVPEQWKRVYLDWMREIRPWCISRQLWWGHRLPVWYCDACEETIVAEDAAGALRRLRRRAAPGRGRARHLVQLGALAVRDARLARRDPGAARLLPDRLPHHRARDPLPLGRADGDDGARVHRRRPLRRRLRPLGDPGAATGGGCRRASAPASTRWTRSTSTAPTRCASACWRCPRPRTCATPTPRSSRAQDLANKLWNASPADPAEHHAARTGCAAGCDATGRVPQRVEDRWILSRLQRAIEAVTEKLDAYDFAHAARRLYSLLLVASSATGTWRSSSRASTTARPRRRRPALGARADACPAAPADALRHRGDLVVPPGVGEQGQMLVVHPFPEADERPDRRGRRARRSRRAIELTRSAAALARPGRGRRRERAPARVAGEDANRQRVRRAASPASSSTAPRARPGRASARSRSWPRRRSTPTQVRRRVETAPRGAARRDRARRGQARNEGSSPTPPPRWSRRSARSSTRYRAELEELGD